MKQRLKDPRARLLFTSVAVLVLLICLAVLGKNLYRAHYARQQVWPECNPDDYALASISYHYRMPYSFGYYYAAPHFLTEPNELAELCRLLNEHHNKWSFHPMDHFQDDQFFVELVRSSDIRGYDMEDMDRIVISFYDNMAWTSTIDSKFSGGFPVDSALQQALLDLYDASLDSTCPTPTAQQLRGAGFTYLQRGKEVSSHPVAAEDLPALCEALADMAEKAEFSENFFSTAYPTGLRLTLELEDIIFDLTFTEYRPSQYFLNVFSDRYNQGRYLLPEGFDPFAALDFPVVAKYAS